MMSEVELESKTTVGIDGNNSMLPKSQRPLTLKFENVTYKIKAKAPPTNTNIAAGDRPVKTSSRTILENVSGMVFPGEILAMMGPSGSGKTTLLTAIGARPLSGKLTGTISYNGRPFSSTMRRTIGFVTQDDVLYPHLTVYETLLYTALLRLPRTLSRAQKAHQVELVTTQLGLSGCRNSIVGNPAIRGVSGGERKRVSIGQEMMVNPSLIFLDEPTSGLDSTTAQKVVSVLWDLATNGRTVVMTIHQPSSRIFYTFHKVLLLSDGKPLYFGKGSEVMSYFDGIGFHPSVAMNPSDFILDLANGITTEESQESPYTIKQTLISAYSCHLEPQIKMEITASEGPRTNQNNSCNTNTTSRSSATWWEQFQVLLRRDLKERKHRTFSPVKIIQITLTTILAGLIWWRCSTASDQAGLLFFLVGFWSFSPMSEAIFTFPQERAMLQKERSSGMYKLSSYFMARSTSDLPMELILPILSTATVYWMSGLRPTPTAFFATLFLIVLNVLVTQGLGLLIGALFMDLKTASTLANVVLLLFMLAGGFFVKKVPVFVEWTKYISSMHYSFQLALLVQRLPDQSIAGTNRNAGVVSVVALVAMLVLFRVGAYLALMRVGRGKK